MYLISVCAHMYLISGMRTHVPLSAVCATHVPYQRMRTHVPYQRYAHTCTLSAVCAHMYRISGMRKHVPYQRYAQTCTLSAKDSSGEYIYSIIPITRTPDNSNSLFFYGFYSRRKMHMALALKFSQNHGNLENYKQRT